MSPMARVRLDSLTALRFFAALVVVLSHSTRDLVEVPGLSTVARAGTVGVGFFFALSGFVLTWSYRQDDTAIRFYRRRFARVYPMHILTYVTAIPVLLLAGRNMAGASVSLGGAIASPLLIQAWFPQPEVHYGMNAPSWSLSDEAFFYALCPILLPVIVKFTACRARAAVLALPAVILVGSALGSTLLSDSIGLYLNPAWRLLGFLAGCALAQGMRNGLRAPLGFALASILVLFVFLLLPVLQKLLGFIGLGAFASIPMLDAFMLPLFLMLIMAAARHDLDGEVSWFRRPFFRRLGEWSFALYLTHWLFIDLVVGVFPAVRELAPPAALLANLAVVIVAVLISACSYYGIERPLEARLRGTRPRAEETPNSV